jgi:hypothetical protein
VKQLYERYPRSSSFYAYENCEASFELMQAAGEEPPNIFSDRGNEVHALLSGKKDPALAGDAEVELATELDLQDKALAKKLYAGLQVDEEHFEERLWLRNGLLPIYSGKPDRWRLYGASRGAHWVYLADFKSGWHPLDHYVATNCQLRSYVVLLDEASGRTLAQAVVAIHKPGKKSPPAVFDRAELDQARGWALQVVAKVTAKGPKTPNRGPWCTYCSGKVLCPAWRKEIEMLAPYSSAVVADIPDLVLAQMAPHLDLAKTVIEKLMDRLKERVKERPDLFVGWRFAPGEARRSLDPARNEDAFEILVTKGADLTFADFLASARMSVTALEASLMKNRHLSKPSATELLNTKLAAVIEKKLPDPHLVYDPAIQSETTGPTALPEPESAPEVAPSARDPLPQKRTQEARQEASDQSPSFPEFTSQAQSHQGR